MSRIKHILATFTVVLVACYLVVADDKAPDKMFRLLGALEEWTYPGATFVRANSSDAAVTDIYAIKCRAILTTPDSVEKVVDFYCKKLNVNTSGKNLDEKEGERVTTSRAIVVHDLSGDRPNSLYLIAIYSSKNSNTLVISRSADDKITQIGWSDFRELQP